MRRSHHHHDSYSRDYHERDRDYSARERSRDSGREGREREIVRNMDEAEELDEGVIEVQVIPQDDNWGETATTITETATSVGMSETDINEKSKDSSRRFEFHPTRHVAVLLYAVIGLLAVASPIVFLILPQVMWKPYECVDQCDSLYMNFACKEMVLLIGIWALYFRKPRITMPRIYVLRATVMGLVFVVVVCYWLFYSLRIVVKQQPDYTVILSFAISLVDSLLFLHYLSLVVLWARQRDSIYTIKVIRSTDGYCRYYSVGHQSIQRTAVYVIESYYKDFPEHNPHLLRTPARSSTKHASNLKFYDIDGKVTTEAPTSNSNSRGTKAVLAAASRRNSGRNDRFYEEAEFERRVKKRRARLITAVEEAFTHVKKMHHEKSPCVPMDPEEAAHSIFPSFARVLQKYLRTTKQHHRFTMDSIIKHLAHSLTFDLTPRAFLERYLIDCPSSQLASFPRGIQYWRIVCEEQVTKPLSSNTVFQLKHIDFSLVITVNPLPQIELAEEDFDYDGQKFVLRLNSETSV